MGEKEGRVEQAIGGFVWVALLGPPLVEALDWIGRIELVRQYFPEMDTISALLPPEGWRIAVFLFGLSGLLSLRLARDKDYRRWIAVCVIFACWAIANLFVASRAQHPINERRIPQEVQKSITLVLGECGLAPGCRPDRVKVVWDGSLEGKKYASDFVNIFTDAKWPVEQALWAGHMHNATWFVYDPDHGSADRAREVLKQLNLAFTDVHHNPSTPGPAREWAFWIGPPWDRKTRATGIQNAP